MDIIKETADKYQPLFNLMSEEYGLTLTMSEMDDIITKVDEVKQLFITNVVGRSEQLLALAKWIQENGNHMTPENQVKYYLEDSK